MAEGVAPSRLGAQPIGEAARIVEGVHQLKLPVPFPLRFVSVYLVEFNEAFAAQTLAVVREVGLELEKTNVNGGAIALGHPMGATGTKLTIQLIHEMKRRSSKYGMVTMCIGGGMGAAGIFENLQN